MPKKRGVNTKKQEGQQRKKNKKLKERLEKEKAAEDAKWVDNDKKAARKKDRDNKQRSKIQEKDRKDELKRRQAEQEEKELAKVKPKTKKKGGGGKVTRFQIQQNRFKYLQKLKNMNKTEDKKVVLANNLPLERNTNRDQVDTGPMNVDEALEMLEGEKEKDRHPEKRRKAAWRAFQERRYQEMKAEHPTLKRSQINERIFKEWQSSPENPMNQQ